MKKSFNKSFYTILIILAIGTVLVLFKIVTEQQSTILKYQDELNNIEFSYRLIPDFLVRTTNILTNGYKNELLLEEAKINNSSSSDSTDLLIIGHVYGNPGKKGSDIPAGTLLSAIDELNALSPGLIVLLGDLTFFPSLNNWKEFEMEFLSRMDAPVINSIGNHDITSQNTYFKEFGQTYFYTRFHNSLVVVLDSIVAECYIVGSQEKMLQEAIQTAVSSPDIENILIFTHRLIFLDSTRPLSEFINGLCFASNFDDLLVNYLYLAEEHKPVYVFAGDVGAFGGGMNLSPYYEKISDRDIFLIAVGLGDGENDKVIFADTSQPKLSFRVISLSGEEVLPLEEYNSDYWDRYYGVMSK